MVGGLCQCGCGLPTTIPLNNDAAHGYVKGVPLRYRRGHHTGKPQTWIELGCGFSTPCHVWQGGRSGRYGWARPRDGHRAAFAHILAYVLEQGPVPEGRHLHHLCGNPLCVRVDHLAVKESAEHLSLHRSTSGRISRLTAEEILDIQQGGMTLPQIMVKYGISKTHASRVRRGGIKTRHH